MDHLAVCRLDAPVPPVMATPLSVGERKLLETCGSEKRRREVNVTRRLLRYGLHEYLGETGETVQWGETGPSYVGPRHDVGLSVSHDDRCAAIAWSASGRIGIDIESLESARPWRRIMAAMFSDDDIDWIMRGAEKDSEPGLSRFLAVWTSREAYAKYSGGSVLGQLSRPLLREVEADERGGGARDIGCVEVRIEAGRVTAVCRPLRRPMPGCSIYGPESLRDPVPYRADYTFVAGEDH